MADKECKHFLLTIQEVSQYLNVSKTTIRRAIKLQGFPKGIKILACKRWSTQEILQWIAEEREKQYKGGHK